MSLPPVRRFSRPLATLSALTLCIACGRESQMTDPAIHPPTISSTANALTQLNCTASVSQSTVSCFEATPISGLRTDLVPELGGRNDVVGGQGTYVQLTSSNVSYDAGTELFQFDVTVQNLMNEAIGTPDGTVVDPDGVKVFFYQLPVATSGTGTITVANADGTGTFVAANEPYFQYTGVLAQNQVSSAKTWQFSVPPTVNSFTFTVYLSTLTQPLLVINEMGVNPGGTITDANGEWLEVYNAGSRKVDMQGLFMADSAASGRRPYWMISSSLVVQPGGYVVFGNTTNTTLNGGVPVNYAYGALMTFANSLDACKISRVFGTDTLTIDYVHYSNPGVSAQNGISRELKNPALDNLNMDGSNWADASVTAVYGPGGRGTPGAQNSSFVP